jgi:Golgi phosphoprotein 3 (GPP34)
MLIAEEFLLLSLDDVYGKKTVAMETLEPALGGALLAELALLERIGVTPRSAGWRDRGRVTVTSTVPTDDPELDRVLIAITAREGKKVKDLITPMSSKRLSKGVPARLLARLVASGVLSEDRQKMLGFIPTTRWHTRDPEPEEELRGRLQSALVGGATPTERTVALIGLLQVTNLLPRVIYTEDKKALRRRAKELTEGDWAAKAVKDAIEEVSAVMATAAVAGAAGAGGAS